MTISGSGDNPGQASGCQCACHTSSGSHRACDRDAGYGTGCGPHGDAEGQIEPCRKCGRIEGHAYLLTDCIFEHDGHADRHVGLLCKRHYHWISDTLTQIEELFSLVPDAYLPGVGGDGIPSNEVHSPAPGNIMAMAITDRRAKTPIDLELDLDEIPDIPGTLASWLRVCAEERGLEADYTSVARVIGQLRGNRHWIASQDWIDDYVNELGDVHRILARVVRDTMWPKPIGKCPNCQSALFNTIGLDQVTCRKCGSVWSGVHLARLRLIHEQEQAKESA